MKSLSPHAHWLIRAAIACAFLSSGAQMMKMALQGPSGFHLFSFLFGLMQVLGSFLILYGGLDHVWATGLGCLLLIAFQLLFIKHYWGQWSLLSSPTHPYGGIEWPLYNFCILIYLLFWNPNLKEIQGQEKTKG